MACTFMRLIRCTERRHTRISSSAAWQEIRCSSSRDDKGEGLRLQAAFHDGDWTCCATVTERYLWLMIEELNQRFAHRWGGADHCGEWRLAAGVHQHPRGNGGDLPARRAAYLLAAGRRGGSDLLEPALAVCSRDARFAAASPFAFPGFAIRRTIPKHLRTGSCAPRPGNSTPWRAHGDAVMVSLSTGSDEGTRAWWPHDFHLHAPV